jgi:hypothetical protein
VSKLSTCKTTILLAVTLFALVRISWATSPTTFSLSGDWSNTTNPNGPWSYNQASNPLPLVTDWTAAGTAFVGCSQPAWAPSNNAGNFLPALMKANSCTAKDVGTDPHNGRANVEPGDIVVHTVDSFNGNPALGVANFLFTLPAGDDGTYQIRGSVWDAGLYYGTTRPQDWELLVDGVKKASGFLSGSVSRSQAETFDISVDLHAGDTVDLELFKDSKSSAGYFVGTNMSIGPPECILTDTLSFNATSGILTMKFTVGTPSAATWNGWLTYQNTLESLWSRSLPITEPPVTETKTHALARSGEVGILSTLTTPTGGIICSSWQTIGTGEP